MLLSRRIFARRANFFLVVLVLVLVLDWVSGLDYGDEDDDEDDSVAAAPLRGFCRWKFPFGVQPLCGLDSGFEFLVPSFWFGPLEPET